MKDPQPPARALTGGIFFVSVTLHCLSMPILVFLRRDFGYAYLGPKKIMLALVFACALLSYAVWHDDMLRSCLLFPTLFGATASSLYLLHLTLAVIRQGRDRAQHDQESGCSHLLAFLTPDQRMKREGMMHSLIEPAIIVAVGYFLAPSFLGSLLQLCGWSLALKEWIRWWLVVRLQKRTKDGRNDAEEMMDEVDLTLSQSVSKSGKTGRQRFERRS